EVACRLEQILGGGVAADVGMGLVTDPLCVEPRLDPLQLLRHADLVVAVIPLTSLMGGDDEQRELPELGLGGGGAKGGAALRSGDVTDDDGHVEHAPCRHHGEGVATAALWGRVVPPGYQPDPNVQYPRRDDAGHGLSQCGLG